MALDLSDRAARIPLLDESVRRQARARLRRTRRNARFVGTSRRPGRVDRRRPGPCPPTALTRIRLACFAGDHGIAAAEVSAQAADGHAGPCARPARYWAPGISPILRPPASGSSTSRSTPTPRACRPRWKIAGSGAAPGGSTSRTPSRETRPRPRSEWAPRSPTTRWTGAPTCSWPRASGSRPARPRRHWPPSSPRRRSPPSSAGVHSSTTATGCASAAVRDAARRGRRILASKGDMIDLIAAIGGADLAALTGFVSQRRPTPDTARPRRIGVDRRGRGRTANRAADDPLGGRRAPVRRPRARRVARDVEARTVGRLRDGSRRRHGRPARGSPPSGGDRVARRTRRRGRPVR